MLPEKRRENIIKEIKLKESVKVSHLSNKFNVTKETIRKDLEKLDKRGLIKRIHGGALSASNNLNEISFNLRKEKNVKEKKIIAKKAAKLINENTTLFLDASTTCLFLAKEISNINNLTIVTNSMRIAYELIQNNNITLIATGGYLRSNSFSYVGNLANKAIREYNADYFFASCSGLSIKNGATETNEFETEVKSNMANNSHKTVILADNTKFNKDSLKTFVETKDIDIIITNEIINKIDADNFKNIKLM